MLEKKYGCVIVKEPLKDYIGIAEMFIYVEGSTTGRFGEMLKIPSYTIPADFFRRDYEEKDFSALKAFYQHHLRESVSDHRDITVTGEIDTYDFLAKVLREGYRDGGE